MKFPKDSRYGIHELEGLAEVFRVLADPVRLALLHQLRGGEKTVSELVEVVGMAQSSVSKHLKTLASPGFIRRRKEGVRVHYSLEEDFLRGSTCCPLCGLIYETLTKTQGKGTQEGAA